MFRSDLIKATVIAAGMFALTACGGQKAADANADAAKAAATEKPVVTKQKTVFDDQLRALDKAKAVEKQMQEDKEKQDKAIQDQGG